MSAITNLDSVDKILRQEIIRTSGVDPSYVRNSLSQFGTMAHRSGEDVFDSIDPNDALVLFERRMSANSSDVSFEDGQNIIQTLTLTYHIYVYGNTSSLIASRIQARLMSAPGRQLLYDQGVYMERASNCISVNEFDNESLWPRTDFDLTVAVELQISPLDDDYAENNLSSLNIINKEYSQNG